MSGEYEQCSAGELLRPVRDAEQIAERLKAIESISNPAAFVRDARAVADYYRHWPGCCESIGLSDAVDALARHFPKEPKP